MEAEVDPTGAGVKRTRVDTPQTATKTTPMQPVRKKQAGATEEPENALPPTDLYARLKQQMGSPSPLKADEMVTPQKQNKVYTPEPACGDPYVILDSPLVAEAMWLCLGC